MLEEVTFVQNQLWAVIALLTVLIVSTVVCNLTRKAEKKTESEKFPELWELGKLDDLIVRSTDYLKEYPNNVNALYFGAKALVVRKQYIEVKERVSKLFEIEPSLKEAVKEILEEIENAESS